MKSQEEQVLYTRIEQVRGKLQGLTADLHRIDDELEGLAPQRMQHELLGKACGSLEKLGELGVASLFWGEHTRPAEAAEHLRQVRARSSGFQARLDEHDRRRQAILDGISREEQELEILGEDLYHAREEEERRKLEWVVERDIGPSPRRVQVLAWAGIGEEDWRFRKALAASLLVSLLLGLLLPMIDLPLPKRFEAADVPKRLAQLIREEQAKPLPRPPVVEEKPSDDKPKEQKPKPAEEPKPVEQHDPRPPEVPALAEQPKPKAVEKAGILAFKEKFASLAKDDVAPRLGLNARLSEADDASRGQPTRSMLTTNGPGSSGGINLASLSRNVGGGGGAGGGGGIQGVQVGRASSSIASIGGGGDDRPLARGGPGLSRTDEEIQIVFDRYKSAFYRLYNRELRKDPTLRGQMVLRLTIEPDGSVSMCVLQSSDMQAPELSAQVVDRVRLINFGAKEEVQALTIVYPIDFLPAA